MPHHVDHAAKRAVIGEERFDVSAEREAVPQDGRRHILIKGWGHGGQELFPAVGWSADQIKVGSINQSDRLAKYNRLLAIEAQTKLPVVDWPCD